MPSPAVLKYFNNSNYLYAYPQDSLESVSEQTPQQQHSNSNKYNNAREYSHEGWGVEIDYKHKSVALMKKNMELEIDIKQYQCDIANLQQEVQKLVSVIKDIVGVFDADKSGMKIEKPLAGNLQSQVKYIE